MGTEIPQILGLSTVDMTRARFPFRSFFDKCRPRRPRRPRQQLLHATPAAPVEASAPTPAPIALTGPQAALPACRGQNPPPAVRRARLSPGDTYGTRTRGRGPIRGFLGHRMHSRVAAAAAAAPDALPQPPYPTLRFAHHHAQPSAVSEATAVEVREPYLRTGFA